MSDKDLSKQEKIIVALLVALVLSLGWGHWLPESAQTRGVRVSKGALTKASFSRNVPKYDLWVCCPWMKNETDYLGSYLTTQKISIH